MTTTVETATGATKTMVLNMGPQHPSTHGVLRILLELDGETVVKAVPDIGYLHTGIEKSCEDKTYSQVTTLTDRMDYLNPLGNNLVYALAVEKLLGLEVPKRAQYIRVMMVELQRISSHLIWLGTHAIDLGAMSVFLYCFREREEILKLFELFAGQRMMTSYIRIGGVALDPPAGWREKVDKVLRMMPSRIDEYETLLTENRIWMARTKGVGVIKLEDAIAYSMTGPTLRAAGLAYDNRKVFPYSSYEEFDFNVPTRTDSDCFGRYMLRIAEMRESLKIVKQAMEKITDQGPIKTEAAGIIPPQREKMKTEMEALIYHFKIFTEGFSPAPGEAYVTVESPRGELGCFIASDGSPKPLRCHFRAPSFINLQALPKIVEGQIIADVVACIGTIDIVLGDVDR
ncbi:MAG TPA: NADH dehydrogenase (quinone) subunit D [Candidatus Sulfotelmatobacter sp.]|jgi:NADH-quinone oxidoreductase subunit D|nr:NADH dehydrogenase (quinone) subunit D [Candidatus Sulfotelmatobacter sp.]